MDRKRYFVPTEIAEKSFEVLKPQDVELLINSGKRICSAIIADYPDELPNGLIFPVTSAPPLWHLINEVLQKVATARKLDVPKSFPFVNLTPPIPTERDTYFDVLNILSFMKEKER